MSPLFILLSFGILLPSLFFISSWLKKLLRWLIMLFKIVLIILFITIAFIVYTRPYYVIRVAKYIFVSKFIPIISKADNYFLSLPTESSYELPAAFSDIYSFSTSPYSLPLILALSLIPIFALFICCSVQNSGGRYLGSKSSNSNSTSESEPLLIVSQSSLLKSLQNLIPRSSSFKSRHDVNSQLLEAITKLQQSIDRLTAPDSDECEGIFAADIKIEPLSSTSPHMYKRLADLSPEEALKELSDEVKRLKDSKKKPVFLTEQERELPAADLYLKFKTENIQKRENDFLQQLSTLPTDVQQWSLADIKRWFRDRRHEQWAIRQIKANRPLFICPHCDRARDAQTHKCIPLWQRPTTRAGIPVQQQTYISQSPSGFRVGQRTVLDSDRITEIEDRITKARQATAEANQRLTQIHASARAITTPNQTTDDNTFPYANNPTLQGYSNDNSQFIDLTEDEEMPSSSSNQLNNTQQATSINAISHSYPPFDHHSSHSPQYQQPTSTPTNSNLQSSTFQTRPTPQRGP